MSASIEIKSSRQTDHSYANLHEVDPLPELGKADAGGVGDGGSADQMSEIWLGIHVTFPAFDTANASGIPI